MKSGPQPEPRLKMLKLDMILAFGVLVIVIIAASWYAASHHKSSQNNSGIPTGWSQFKSNKYGFKFNYPGSWGKPQLTNTAGQTGSHYQISFVKDPKATTVTKNLTVSIGIDSSNYAPRGCSSTSCQSALTSQVITSHLNTGSKSLLKHDLNSYAFLATVAGSSTLIDVQTVSLTKISATGALGTYTLSTSDSCPAGKFAAAGQQGCIKVSNYNTLNQVMKSIQGV